MVPLFLLIAMVYGCALLAHLFLSNPDYEVLHVVPLRVNELGEGLLPLQEPLKPKEVEVPAGIEPL